MSVNGASVGLLDMAHGVLEEAQPTEAARCRHGGGGGAGGRRRGSPGAASGRAPRRSGRRRRRCRPPSRWGWHRRSAGRPDRRRPARRGRGARSAPRRGRSGSAPGRPTRPSRCRRSPARRPARPIGSRTGPARCGPAHPAAARPGSAPGTRCRCRSPVGRWRRSRAAGHRAGRRRPASGRGRGPDRHQRVAVTEAAGHDDDARLVERDRGRRSAPRPGPPTARRRPGPAPAGRRRRGWSPARPPRSRWADSRRVSDERVRALVDGQAARHRTNAVSGRWSRCRGGGSGRPWR